MSTHATHHAARSTALRRRAALVLLALLAVAAEAGATELAWQGTLSLDVGFGDPLAFEGAGVATINQSGGAGSHLTTLRIAGGIAGSATIPITDPDVTATLPRVELSVTLGTGTLQPFYPSAPYPDVQLTRSALPVKGMLRLCTFSPSCNSYLPIPLTGDDGQHGVGVGGILTAGGFGNVRVSIENGAWTPWTATMTAPTPMGGTLTVEGLGWIHGPFSFASTAGTTGGAIQLVSPIRIASNQTQQAVPAINRLTLRFVPEPGMLLMLAAGIVALVRLAEVDR